ncbi:hypothetical protein HYV80_02075 [Candidatus Woesearchaeota archaeon]|nr:hypothetical protein [Candidatus Woesearchaeota archaeon]
MAFFKFGKKKKEDQLDTPMPSPEIQAQAPSSPIEQVLMMKQQGYTNNQIVQTLQSQGYNTNQIFDAINQAGLSGGFEAMPEQAPLETGMQDYGQSYEQQQQQPYQQQYQFQPTPPEIKAPASIDEERIQEVAEAVIDEKWEAFAKDIRKVIEWKESSENRLSKIEQQMIDLRLSIDSLTKSMITKISAYDQNIVDVGTEIKAMEKVFQKVLPNLTESVNKLDRMTKGASPQKK